MYPAHREADVVLRDGSTIHVRPIRPGDADAIAAFVAGLSLESLALRFFSGAVNERRVAQMATDVDYADRFGLVATVEERIVAHAAYFRTGTDRAEVAFMVADDMQGHGIATILLGQLAEAAEEHGIPLFTATVLPRNRKMLDVFRQSGLEIRKLTSGRDEIQAEFPTSLGPGALERYELRERESATNALRTFLRPRAVAVIGASRERGTIGGEVFHNLLSAGFEGPVYPVNRSADVVQSVRAYRSVTEIDGPVDLVVISVPAPHVADAARACAAKGVRALVVLSSGFAEVGNEARQRELVEICRASGMRLIGPNCMGILNAHAGLNATFAPGFPPSGRVGFMSQSGALGLAVIERAASLGIGLSSFISVGNKADISGNDLLQYWETDPDTDLILLYLESFGNPRRFGRISRRVGRTKPIVAVKSGRSTAGARATSSHTGAMLAASDDTVDALFRTAGVIRTETLAELFDVASLLSSQPLPSGPRVGIVTNAGGLGILCADACEAGGLDVVGFSEALRGELAAGLPGEASVSNPVDMIASASAADYLRTVRTVASSGEVDSVIVIFIPPLVTPLEQVAAAVRDAAASVEVPLLAVFATGREVTVGGSVPVYGFPEDAARALAHAVGYAAWRSAPQGEVPSFEGVRREDAAAVTASALADGPRWLRPDEVARLFASYGIPVVASRVVATEREAAEAAAGLGTAVALKAVGPVHKTEVGGVRLGLGPDEVEAAAAEMRGRVGDDLAGFLVQAMAPRGVEMLAGVVHDASFGPVVACGAGGTAVELLHDVAVRIAPLTDVDVRTMLRSLRTYPLLEGYRGAPKADVPALEELLLRLSALADDRPEIAELECNPVVVHPGGVVVVDARVRVEQPAPRPPLGARTVRG